MDRDRRAESRLSIRVTENAIGGTPTAVSSTITISDWVAATSRERTDCHGQLESTSPIRPSLRLSEGRQS